MSVCPIYWNRSDALTLNPLPDVLVIADQRSPFSITHKDCVVFNPVSIRIKSIDDVSCLVLCNHILSHHSTNDAFCFYVTFHFDKNKKTHGLHNHTKGLTSSTEKRSSINFPPSSASPLFTTHRPYPLPNLRSKNGFYLPNLLAKNNFLQP